MDQTLSELTFNTSGEGFNNITSCINSWIASKKIIKGILIISTKHTSCSLIINENADPNVLKDLSRYMKSLVPEKSFIALDGESNPKEYLHSEEGLDDMPAHIKTMLTCTTLSLSINQGELVLGTWQAIYLWEHRYTSHSRKLNFHAIGEFIY